MLVIDKLKKTNESEIKLSDFLIKNEHLLPDPVSLYVDIRCYAKKLIKLGENLIATIDGNTAGIICGYANDYSTRRSHIQLLIVNEQYQNRYVGSELLEGFIKLSIEKKMKEIILTCDESNIKAEIFYRKHGFQDCIEKPIKEKKKYLLKKLLV